MNRQHSYPNALVSKGKPDTAVVIIQKKPSSQCLLIKMQRTDFCQAQLNGNETESETRITLLCDGAGKTLKSYGVMTRKRYLMSRKKKKRKNTKPSFSIFISPKKKKKNPSSKGKTNKQKKTIHRVGTTYLCPVLLLFGCFADQRHSLFVSLCGASLLERPDLI